jgi:UDP-N-acetylmuramate: L-alanyl-gamma-D-glutamyl-meso-diaminopimelate ligase
MHIHFIAVGGSAMHNLALALHEAGHKVTGSDDQIFEPSRTRLLNEGLLPEEEGWFPEKITHDKPDQVILGMHARQDNPELRAAEALGIPIFSYPEYLYEQSKLKTRVVIAGSHGKTTITSMILHVHHYHSMECDYMVGAQLEGFKTMVRITNDAEFKLLEGDEYLSSPIDRRPKFIHYKPNITLISGIAWDHVNVFPSFDMYVDQFKQLLDVVEPGGVVIYNEDDAVLRDLVLSHPAQIKRFPYRTPDYQTREGNVWLNTFEGEVPLKVFGAHNLLNLEGARLICNQMRITDEEFYEAIASFGGASKRLELIGSNSLTKVYKDFAHAPSKVEATTKALKELHPERKLVACLELHTFSSLNPEFIKQYRGALDAADQAVVYYNPEAVAHKKLPPLSLPLVREAFANEMLLVFESSEILKEYLLSLNWKDSNLLLMSSGNFDNMRLEQLAQEICHS